MPHLTWEPAVKFTDLLTTVSVICATLTLIFTLLRDRNLRRREYADRVRAAAAETLSKIDRAQSVFLSIGQRIQVPITEIDELLVSKRDAVLCRDTFWKALFETRAKLLEQLHDEKIKMAYAPLFVYRRDVYDRFKKALAAAYALDQTNFDRLQSKCQTIILDSDEDDPESAVLGNELRDAVDKFEAKHASALEAVFAELREYLRLAVTGSDSQLLESTG